MTDDFQAPSPGRSQLRPLDAAADAVRFFTRLPVPARFGSEPATDAMAGIAAASPLGGLLVGAGSAAVLALALAIGLPATFAAVLATAAAATLSGSLHLDGLADVADGFGGGRDTERKLAIMRDSRLGTYGGAALALALMGRVTLIAALADRLDVWAAVGAVIATAALARPLAFLPTLLLDPARAEGLGRSARPDLRMVAIGLAIAAAIALVFAGLGGLVALAVAAAAAGALSALARRQIGGYTGDVCGAAAELAEIAALATLVVVAGAF